MYGTMSTDTSGCEQRLCPPLVVNVLQIRNFFECRTISRTPTCLKYVEEHSWNRFSMPRIAPGILPTCAMKKQKTAPKQTSCTEVTGD